ncbi:MAG: AAA family ATPase [Candidatus Krumholzibacteriia bacterium]
MIFLDVKLCNFRGFYGETPRVKFSTAGGQNVTLLHAVNGAGKTTMLNALTWALYGTTTFSSGKLLNRQAVYEAKDGDDLPCWVELNFRNSEHGEVIFYFLRREINYLKGPNDRRDDNALPTRLTLIQKLPSGESQPMDVESAQLLINRIIPQELSRYFFFEGENPARLGNPNNEQKKTIADATKKLLGVEVLDRTLRHINKSISLLERELAKTGPDELKDLVQEKGASEERLEVYREDLEICLGEADCHKNSALEARELLAGQENSKDLEEQRRRLENSRVRSEQRQIELRARLKSEFSKNGALVLLDKIRPQFETITTQMRQKGELPKGIKKQFIEDLLETGRCICETPLDPGSVARERVERWRIKAGIPIAEEKVIHMVAHMKNVQEEAARFLKAAFNIQKQIREEGEEIESIEAGLAEIRGRLVDSNVELVAVLEKTVETEEELYESKQREIGRLEGKVAELEREIAAISLKIEKVGKKKHVNSLVSLRIRAAKCISQMTQDLRDRLANDFRESLEASVQKIYNEITIVPYQVIVNDDFSVDLFTNDQAPEAVDPSRGESQVLSLAFLGGIIDETRKYYKHAAVGAGDYIQYPIFMDAPFGQLDPGHRRHVASRLASIADQIIILVTPTQYRGEVEEAIGPQTGKHYLMKYFTTRHDFDERKKEDYLVNIDGSDFSLVEESRTGFEYTQIVEL